MCHRLGAPRLLIVAIMVSSGERLWPSQCRIIVLLLGSDSSSENFAFEGFRSLRQAVCGNQLSKGPRTRPILSLVTGG